MPQQDPIYFRRGPALSWRSANPVLDDGEPGVDGTLDLLKIGDGVTSWLDLPTIGRDTTLVRDDFNRANNTLVPGAPQIGPTPSVVSNAPGGGTAGIIDNRLYFPTGAAGAYTDVLYQTGKADVVAEITFPVVTAGQYPGLTLRSPTLANGQDATRFLYNGAWRMTAGTDAGLGLFSASFVGGDRMRVVMHGLSAKVYRKTGNAGMWALVGTYVLATGNEANMIHGVNRYDGAAGTSRYDDLWIGELTPGIELECRIADIAADKGGDVTAAAAFGADNRLIRSDGTGKGVQASGITIDDDDDIILPEAGDIQVGTATGSKIGTGATEKLGFFGATPVVQPAATVDLGTVLSNLGLRVAGVAYPLSTSGLVSFSGPWRNAAQLRTAAQTLTIGSNFHPNICDANAGAFTVTLTDTNVEGYEFWIIKIDSSANAVTVAGTSINGATTYVLAKQYDWVRVRSTGTTGAWLVVGASAVAAVWTAYTPTWTATTTNPAIGNGTIEGKYCQIGKTVHYWARITMGSTTTFGSGTWFLGLPIDPLAAMRWVFQGTGRDASASATWPILAEYDSTLPLRLRVLPTAAAGGSLVSIDSGVPFTWASSDSLFIAGTYESV